MILTLFRRIFREHSGDHFWIPILVVAFMSLGLDILPAIYQEGYRVWAAGVTWGSTLHEIADKWRELAGIYIAFGWVVVRSVRRASDVQWSMTGDLADHLRDADRYFAIGTIPLHEWFEPNTLVYLATIFRRQFNGTGGKQFRHERVLLFFDDAHFEALQASYLDQHYARSFSAIHDRFNAPLAYLRPSEFHGILKHLSAEERLSLALPSWFAIAPWVEWILGPLARDLSRPRPFAVVYKGVEQTMLRFVKTGRSLTVEEIEDPAEVEACRKLVELIDKRIHRQGTPELLERYRFNRYLCP